HVLDGSVKLKGHRDGFRALAFSSTTQFQSCWQADYRETALTAWGAGQEGPGPPLQMYRYPVSTSLHLCGRIWSRSVARDFVLPDNGQAAIDPELQIKTN